MMMSRGEVPVIDMESGSKQDASLKNARRWGSDHGVEAIPIFRISKLPLDSKHTSHTGKCNLLWVISSAPRVMSPLLRGTQNIDFFRRKDWTEQL